MKEYTEIQNPFLRWVRKHLVVLMAFFGLGTIEGFKELYKESVDYGIKQKEINDIRELILKDGAIERIDRKNRQQDRKLKDLQQDVEFLMKTEL